MLADGNHIIQSAKASGCQNSGIALSTSKTCIIRLKLDSACSVLRHTDDAVNIQTHGGISRRGCHRYPGRLVDDGPISGLDFYQNILRLPYT